jgi:hypothetical protein
MYIIHFISARLISNIVQTIRKPKEGNSALIAWMVSNFLPDQVHTDRVMFAQKLQSYLDVDIYGSLGPFKVADLSHQFVIKFRLDSLPYHDAVPQICKTQHNLYSIA